MDYPLSITKEEINLFPQYKYQGTIELIESAESALIAIESLKNESILGFDTETRASFKKGEKYDVSLVQLATSTHVYLFRLNKFLMPNELAEIFANPKVIKTGIAVKDDIKGLKKIVPFEENSFIDLAPIVKKNGFENFGLRALTAIFLKKRLSKKEKISNWERNQLTEGQIHYAACDAAVGFEIYQIIKDLFNE